MGTSDEGYVVQYEGCSLRMGIEDYILRAGRRVRDRNSE